MATVSAALAPSPGFCVKSVTLAASDCSLTPPPPPAAGSAPERLVLPTSGTKKTIPKGTKVFVNIAYDANVPPPPDSSEDAIQRAMRGDELPEGSGGGWFVPLVVPAPREDTDKAGRPSLVFDCIFHSSLKSRALKEPAFKTFLIELAFQRIETAHGVPLAREIGTPNIKSKGALAPRTVQIPAVLFPANHPARANASASGKVVEVVSAPAAPKGILKRGEPTARDGKSGGAAETSGGPGRGGKRPELSWSKNGLTEGLTIHLAVPELTRAAVATATLDVEPRRVILAIPPLYALDLDLDAPDEHIRGGLALSRSSAEQALMLKRQRELDVENAHAEWRVAEGRLLIHV